MTVPLWYIFFCNVQICSERCSGVSVLRGRVDDDEEEEEGVGPGC